MTLCYPAAQTSVDATNEPYPRRILLAITGLTPQAVTETVYALLRAGAARFSERVRTARRALEPTEAPIDYAGRRLVYQIGIESFYLITVFLGTAQNLFDFISH